MRTALEVGAQLVAVAEQVCACRGQVIKGQETVVRSRYDEDVYPGNHTSVWGSFWADGRWGYACCKSHLKNALCMGDRVEQVAQQQKLNKSADAADQSGEKLGSQHGSAERNSDSTGNGASDAGAATPLPSCTQDSTRLWIHVYTALRHGNAYFLAEACD